MKEKNDLPFTLTIREIAEILRINVGKAYELAHREDFPSIRLGIESSSPETGSLNG